MESIEQAVAAARRRLVVRQWAGRLATCLTAAFGVALVAILAPKLVALPELPANWVALWLSGAAIVGTIAATVWTFARSRTPLDAAVEIDKRFELRERIASSLSLTEEDLTTEVGAALASDARRALERVEVNERFPFGLDTRAWRPIVPAALALLLGVLVSNREAEALAEKATPAKVETEEVKKAAEKARKELKKKREQAAKEGLKDASALLKKVEEGTGELTKKQPKDATKAAVKLNDLTKQLAERKQKLGGGKQLRNQLNRMKDLGRGPAEKAADAMKKGDWKRAMEEINKLRDQIAGGKVSKEQQKQLAAQLGKMQQKLSQAAKQHQAQKKELQRQLAEAQRKGDMKQANKLQQKMDQLAQKTPQMQQLQQMAQQMQQAQQAMEKGDAQQAQQAMQEMAQQMAQMQKEAQEMEMLDGAMTDIQMAKQAMGMQPGMGQPMPGMGMGMGNQKGKFPGPGMGEGQGAGARPSEENDVAYRDTKVRQNVGRGASTFGGLVKGPSVKGEVIESIKTQLSAETAQPADPLTSERLPRSRREHAKEYFQSLNEKL
ncbi:Chromosome partition protein Smc [Planctomycetes bacterium MalM25]|nr:Chromosome partition protein Smc [Planctomycetes bacterium MalM25]